MDFTIIFCNDGIMRAKYGNNNFLIPLKFIQENGKFKNNDFRFWLKWWDNECFFEEGTTIGTFLLCLEPWANFWGDYVSIDLYAYLKELKKPVSISDIEVNTDYVELSFHNEIEPKIEYHQDDDLLFKEDFAQWINSPKKYRLTGEWNISSRYELVGFHEGEEERYSIEDYPINYISNIPLFLKEKQYIYFSKWQYDKIITPERNNLFSKKAFGIKTHKYNIQYMMGDKFHHLKDVIEGVFQFFHTCPEDREIVVSQIEQALSEIDLNDIQNPPAPEDSNVVSLFSKENKEPNIDIISINNNHIETIENNQLSFWEHMTNLSKNDNNVIVKMGNVKSGEPPEIRVFSTPKNKPEPENKSDYIED